MHAGSKSSYRKADSDQKRFCQLDRFGRIGRVTVGADTPGECGRDRPSTHYDLEIIPDILSLQQIHHFPHAVHGGGHQGGEGDDIGIDLPGRTNEACRWDAAPQIGDRETGRLQHDLDQVLANIVGVSFHDADNYLLFSTTLVIL